MNIFEFLKPQDFPEDHYNALGRLLVEFQYLESSITKSLIMLIQPDALDFTSVILNKLTFNNRLKLLSNFIETHPESYFVGLRSDNESMFRDSYREDVEKVKQGIQLANDLEEKRNRIIHSLWLPAPKYAPQKTVTRIKIRTTRKNTTRVEEYISSAEILSVVEQIKKAGKLIETYSWYLEYLLQTKR